MIRKIRAYFTNGTLVILKDHEGKLYKSIGYIDPFTESDMYAHVYWFTKIGHVTLEKGGRCSGSSSYIHNWMKG